MFNNYYLLIIFSLLIMLLNACGNITKLERDNLKEVSNLKVSHVKNEIILRWSDPISSNFDSVIIAFGPSDTSKIFVEAGVESYKAINLENGKRYNVIIKTADSLGNTSKGVNIEVKANLNWEESFVAKNSLLKTWKRNDPVVFVDAEQPYPYKMIVVNSSKKQVINNVKQRVWVWDFFRAKDADGPWEIYHQMHVEKGETPQWGRKNISGKYYIFSSEKDKSTGLYIGDSLTSLVRWGQVLDQSDSGGFFDPETETWHIFYEKNETDGSPSSWKLGHMSSPDGKNNWIDKGTAIDLDDAGKDWHTGDPDIIKIDDTYFMFIDHTDPDKGHHPYYKISVYKSLDLYKWEDQGLVTEHFGGDACVRFIPEKNKFYMWTEYWTPPSEGVGFGTSPGPNKNFNYQVDPKWNRMDIYISH